MMWLVLVVNELLVIFQKMEELETRNIEFYREQYLFEHERGKFYDKLIQYPTTLLVVFIGGTFYSFNNYFTEGIIKLYVSLDWIFLILLGLLAVFTIITIYFLAAVFHGFTRRYYYLPFTGDLLSHEKKLYKFYYKYSEKNSYQDKRVDAKKNTCRDFTKNLKQYYIELTNINQRINDKRADSYYLTRNFLFIDLILFIIIGIIGFLN